MGNANAYSRDIHTETLWNERHVWPPVTKSTKVIKDDELYLYATKIANAACHKDGIGCKLFEIVPDKVHNLAHFNIVPPDTITFTFPSNTTVTSKETTVGADMVLFLEKSSVFDHVTWLLRLVVFFKMIQCMNAEPPDDGKLDWMYGNPTTVFDLKRKFNFQSVHVCTPGGLGYRFQNNDISLIAVITFPETFDTDYYPASLFVLSKVDDTERTSAYPTFSMVVVIDDRSTLTKDQIVQLFNIMARGAGFNTMHEMMDEIVINGDPSSTSDASPCEYTAAAYRSDWTDGNFSRSIQYKRAFKLPSHQGVFHVCRHPPCDWTLD